MSVRRLCAEQPEAFAFTLENADWAAAKIAQYPPGRQASAVIPLLWKAQEQEGWVSKPAIEAIADMLAMPMMRVLEVATFYTMFHLAPVGRVHVQVCGTTPCMLRGAGELIDACKARMGTPAKQPTANGQFSWEEVECLGACVNAPMVQIGKDYFEDLTPDSLGALLDRFEAGETPRPGPQAGRFSTEPEGGGETLADYRNGIEANGTVDLALREAAGDGPVFPWAIGGTGTGGAKSAAQPAKKAKPPAKAKPAPEPPAADKPEPEPVPDSYRPEILTEARGGAGDDLKQIKGIGPKLEKLLNRLGFWHFDQIAAWDGDNIQWVDEHLEGFRGRIERDDWVAQARDLARDLAKRGDVPSGGK